MPLDPPSGTWALFEQRLDTSPSSRASGAALFEYALHVPANRRGYGRFSLAQLKVTQESITLAVFVLFAVVYMKEQLKLDYLYAAVGILGAAYFIFRSC